MDKVDILLSIYNPNLDYLREQLISINNQTYANIDLYVYDDCIDKRTSQNFINKYITNYPIHFLPYEENNLGYTKAFEKLTIASKGKYVAFCDQDDVWHNDKIEKCVNELKKSHALLVASDKSIIDKDDNIIIPSVRAVSNKNYDSWKTGDDIMKYNFVITFAVGMSMVLDGDFARSIVPFSSYTGHDKWALACAAIEGIVAFIDEPLVDYRRHGNNVSGILVGINTKDDYYKARIKPNENVLNDLIKKYGNFPDKKELLDFIDARKKGDTKRLKKYEYIAPDVVKFEIVMSRIPKKLFPVFLLTVRKIASRKKK